MGEGGGGRDSSKIHQIHISPSCLVDIWWNSVNRWRRAETRKATHGQAFLGYELLKREFKKLGLVLLNCKKMLH